MKRIPTKFFLLGALILGTGTSVAFVYWYKKVYLRPHFVGGLKFCNGNRIRSFEISRRDSAGNIERFRFERREDLPTDIPEAVAQLRAEWVIVEPKLGEADGRFAQRLSGAFCGFATAWEMRGKSADPEAIQAQITLWEEDKAEAVVLKVGKILPNQYVELLPELGTRRLPLYAVSENFARLLQIPAHHMRNRRVMRSTLDMADAIKVEYRGAGRLQLERQGADWRVKQTSGSVPAVKEPDRFINRIGSLQAIEVENKDSSAEECATLASDVTVTIESISRPPETIRFAHQPGGEKNKDAGIIACSSRRQALFRVHNDLWKHLGPNTK